MATRTRVTGFMVMAKRIIVQTPGLTAQEVVIRAFQEANSQGRKLSAAKNPEGSLVATLHKEHKNFEVERRMVNGRYRYYPKGQTITSDAPQTPAFPIDSLAKHQSVDQNDARRIRALVELGRFPDEQTAYRELVKLGLRAILERLSLPPATKMSTTM